MPTDLIVLAAGKGSRMKSALAKVLHPIGGQPMLGQVIQTARTLAPRSVTAVLGYQ
ncbi:MAG TPA: bifunctional N-acetylglucosamine-1-phosphate uridyltransferase/glucosamine-1-phosphate acetyltransferase, partial [Gammaproteobacteria bacterium]|nr:bifunctional N-acetylglucosamine-1-phosphate uridyltransferase/glucosamine-1-phosphate acetyltransferase [Gammaproteobacteria bacterium]